MEHIYLSLPIQIIVKDSTIKALKLLSQTKPETTMLMKNIKIFIPLK